MIGEAQAVRYTLSQAGLPCSQVPHQQYQIAGLRRFPDSKTDLLRLLRVMADEIKPGRVCALFQDYFPVLPMGFRCPSPILAVSRRCIS